MLYKDIDRILIPINITVGTSIPEATYIGNAGIAEVNVSFSVRCAADYYGQECTRFCPDFVNCTECGLLGLTGEFCQFSIDECGTMNCNSNGQCVDGHPVCVCNEGFTGDHCVDIDHCTNISCSGNGQCTSLTDRFTCTCSPGYGGELCTVTVIICTGEECVNGKFVANNVGVKIGYCQDMVCGELGAYRFLRRRGHATTKGHYANAPAQP